MASRRAGNRKRDRDRSTQSDASGEEVRAAESVVEQAREALHRAEQVLERSRTRVTQQAAQTRAVTIGDMLDGTLEFVRRHPVTGLVAVGIIGFLLGRSTRR